jgi:D-threo-aldose 1-dehydrogenase
MGRDAMLTKRTIGKTGLMVTDLGFGGSGLGDMPDTYGYAVSEERARATLQAIFDSDVNLLDTSRAYGFGRSEARIGAAIRERGGLPAGFVLSTKLDRDMETRRFDGDRARASLDESLAALGIDRIPLLHLHDPEHARDLTEITRDGGAIDALFRMKEEGIVQAVGLAMGRLDIMNPLLRDWPWDALITHNRFTLLNRSASAMMDDAVARGIAVLNAAPFAGGVLAKGTAAMPRLTYQEADAAALAPVRAVEAVCAEHGIAPGAAALQFSRRDPRVASTIVGVTKRERVAETLAWARAPISDAAWQALGRLPASDEDPEANRDYKPG